MAKCAICEKAAHFGIQVSHSHRRSNKMWKANVKSVRVKVNGGTQKNVRMYFLLTFRPCRKSLMKQNISRKKTLSRSYRQAVSFFAPYPAFFPLASPCRRKADSKKQAMPSWEVRITCILYSIPIVVFFLFDTPYVYINNRTDYILIQGSR